MAMSPTENTWLVLYTPGDDFTGIEEEREYREWVEAVRFATMIIEGEGEAIILNDIGEQVW